MLAGKPDSVVVLSHLVSHNKREVTIPLIRADEGSVRQLRLLRHWRENLNNLRRSEALESIPSSEDEP
jgi:hypothetical protein